MKIAFLGLGRMGSGMARRLAGAAQHELTVWNRNPDKARPFAREGIAVATDLVAAVSGADLVVTSLLDDASLEAMFHAASPALAAMKPHAIHLCVTTISAECANRMQKLHAESGTRYVSGPVLGRPDAAASGELVQLLAGDASAIAEVEPACRVFAARIVPLPGPAGAANNQKLCINFFLAAMIEAMGECYTLGDSLGVSREALRVMFTQSFAMPGLKSYAERLYARDADGSTGFTMTAGLQRPAAHSRGRGGVELPSRDRRRTRREDGSGDRRGHGRQRLELGSGNNAQAGGAGREARHRLARSQSVSSLAAAAPAQAHCASWQMKRPSNRLICCIINF
jgi:3-hydroxyisobutyrate dehydrogenase-like beta-hydroxyacid dehydrogenase